MSDKEFEEPVVEPDLTDVDEPVVEAEPEPEAELQPVIGSVMPEMPKKKIVIPMPVDIKAVYDALPEPAGPAVVGLGEVDDVYLTSCVFKNEKSRKSLTVHHLQRRLVELGYSLAGRDKDGYYGDLTKVAVAEFQTKQGLESTGVVDGPTMEAVFKGDPNVKVHV